MESVHAETLCPFYIGSSAVTYHEHLIRRRFQSLAERRKDGWFRFYCADLERSDIGVDPIAEEGLNRVSVGRGQIGNQSQTDASGGSYRLRQ